MRKSGCGNGHSLQSHHSHEPERDSDTPHKVASFRLRYAKMYKCYEPNIFGMNMLWLLAN